MNVVIFNFPLSWNIKSTPETNNTTVWSAASSGFHYVIQPQTFRICLVACCSMWGNVNVAAHSEIRDSRLFSALWWRIGELLFLFWVFCFSSLVWKNLTDWRFKTQRHLFYMDYNKVKGSRPSHRRSWEHVKIIKSFKSVIKWVAQ